MVLFFEYTLKKALEEIDGDRKNGTELSLDSLNSKIWKFPVHFFGTKKTEETIKIYGEAKWAIVDLLNENYSTVLKTPFDLYHWLQGQAKDEVAYFLNEAGSNALNYADEKAPSAFYLWRGSKGFIIGIEQEGKGFNAQKIASQRYRENEGAGFEFFRNCQGKVFFDNPLQARVVYFLQKIRD